MPVIPFAAWAPDRSDLDTSVTDVIRNVIPKAASYGPFNSFNAVSTALPGAPRGAFMAKDANGNFQTFAGTATKLYQYDGVTRGWTDVTKLATTYAVPAGGCWSFEQFGNYVIACNGVDANQAFILGTSARFADLAAASPISKRVGVVGDFLCLLNNQAGSSRMTISGLNDPTWWTIGERGCDYQIFPDGGAIIGMAGFEKGAVIFQENAVREMTLALGTQFLYTFQKTDETRAMSASNGVIQAGARCFYVTQNGFFQYGSPPVGIGDERVNQFFVNNASPDYLYEVQSAADPNRSLVYWRYKSTANVDANTSDRVLIYNYAVDRWSYAEVTLSWIFPAATTGVTLDNMHLSGYTDIDAMTVSLDSRSFSGGNPAIAAFDSTYRLGFFSGPPMQAVLQTPDIELNPGNRASVTGTRLIFDGDTATARVARKDRHGSPLSWGLPASMMANGLIPARASGRLHRVEAIIPAGTAWENAHAVEIEAHAEGMR